MKRFLVLAAAAVICSCAKEPVQPAAGKGEESVVYITLKNSSDTRAVGAVHGVPADDGNINTLEIFVFRINEGEADDGMLDGYRKFTKDELGTLSNLEVKTTTGRKIIYAVANAHRSSWEGAYTREEFERITASIADDELKDFLMVGSVEEELQLASSVAFTVKRMVARVKLNSITTSFDSTPYQGMSLEGVKVYLTNVQGEKYLASGEGNGLKVYNRDRFVAADTAGLAMRGMLYDKITAAVDDSGYSTPHYFYCYGNSCKEEKGDSKFTKLVIEATLNGTVYYYPVALEGVERNSCYSLDVVICRPGALSPDAIVEKGTLEAELGVVPWNVLPDSIVEF